MAKKKTKRVAAKKKASRKRKKKAALSGGSGYDAANGSTKRSAASPIIKREDEHLKERQRRTLIGTGHYLHRNFSMVAWAVRRHLDYNTHFNFQARSDNELLNDQLEALMGEWSLPFNCDASGRLNFQQFVRTSELRHIVDGDLFWIMRRDGRLGAVEADLMRTPDKGIDGQKWYNGGQINNDGRVLNWGLHRREDHGQVSFLRRVPSRNVVHLATLDRFDQVRGVSPLAGAFNSFQDVYEGIDYALAKMKVEQLFALIIHNSGASGFGEHLRTGTGNYNVDFGKGPVKLEMDGDDDAKFLSADNPGSNTQEFIQLVLGIAIKALDLPICMLDEANTNFFGSRQAFLSYDRSCVAKREILLEALRRVTIWKMRQWIIEGRLVLPEGMTVFDVAYEWVHVGMPWWDPAKEVAGDLAAIQAGLDNPYRICKERGRGEFEDNIDLIAKAKEYAESKDVNVAFGQAVEQVEPEQDFEEEDE
jgi:capsid protein